MSDLSHDELNIDLKTEDGGESLIFVANGFHCPLTHLAASLGAEHGYPTDATISHAVVVVMVYSRELT